MPIPVMQMDSLSVPWTLEVWAFPALNIATIYQVSTVQKR